MSLEIVATSDRPDLAPAVAGRLWDEFWRRNGHSYEATLSAVVGSVTARPMPRTFILLDAGEAVGTASLAATDLEARPDLSPWLAGVFVAPAKRRHGYVAHLIAAVESEARNLSFPTLWLYTRSAERVYAKVGWRTVENVLHTGNTYALMRRDLTV